MKLSIIIAVLESYEVVRRQLLHFGKMKLPEDIEIIIMDDGSDPPLIDYIGIETIWAEAVFINQTDDKRPWSQPCARNTGAKASEGEYLLMTDIDHILSYDAIMDAYAGGYDKMCFHRHWATLDKDGSINQDEKTLYAYGLPEFLYKERGLHGGMHPNTFAMQRRIFLDMLGGYDERYCGRYGGDDVDFSKRYGHLCRKLKLVQPHVLGRPIYVYPQAREDKKQVLHSMRRNKEHYKLKDYTREDPICDKCGLIYLKCFCYYPMHPPENKYGLKKLEKYL